MKKRRKAKNMVENRIYICFQNHSRLQYIFAVWLLIGTVPSVTTQNISRRSYDYYENFDNDIRYERNSTKYGNTTFYSDEDYYYSDELEGGFPKTLKNEKDSKSTTEVAVIEKGPDKVPESDAEPSTTTTTTEKSEPAADSQMAGDNIQNEITVSTGTAQDADVIHINGDENPLVIPSGPFQAPVYPQYHLGDMQINQFVGPQIPHVGMIDAPFHTAAAPYIPVQAPYHPAMYHPHPQMQFGESVNFNPAVPFHPAPFPQFTSPVLPNPQFPAPTPFEIGHHVGGEFNFNFVAGHDHQPHHGGFKFDHKPKLPKLKDIGNALSFKHNKLKDFKWKPAEKNPFVVYKQVFVSVAESISELTRTDLVFYVEKFLKEASQLSIPKEHYIRVISLAGIYLVLGVLIFGAKSAVIDMKCDLAHNAVKPFRQYTFHAGRRFVPARAVDPVMQRQFLDLFRGVDVDLTENSSEEEIIWPELSFIADMCPRDTFFFSMNPRHVAAVMALQRLFVAQDSPANLLYLARALLHSGKVHPKVWYLGIVAASFLRPDMTGFKIAHPLDAMPDLFIPAHLISDLMKNYRKIRIKRDTISEGNITKLFDDDADIEYHHVDSKTTEEKPKYTISKRKGAYSNMTYTIQSPFDESEDLLYNTTVTIEHHEIPLDKDGNEIHDDSPTGKTIEIGQIELTKNDTEPLKEDKNANKKVNKDQVQSDQKGGDAVNNDDGDKKKKRKKKKDKRKKDKKKKRKKKKKKKKDSNRGDEDCIVVDGNIGIDNGIENELWYWREDMMLNQHHWYWHQTHPPNSTMHAERRAELFYYMHRSLLARYNAERLSNRLPRVVPMVFKPGSVIYEGYNSHLADVNSETYWTPRFPLTPLTDIYHDQDPDFARTITLGGYITLHKRLVKSVSFGKLLTRGGFLPIDSFRGIEPLANTVEAADLSVNPLYYHPMGLHNLGHIMVGLSADPDFRFRRVTGIMSEAAVSMRDPAFYTYHMFLDNFFESYKKRLAPYKVVGGEYPLLWKGVEIVNVQVQAQAGGPVNELRTFWTFHRFELSPGIDRSIEGQASEDVCSQHLDHEPFQFKITIDRKPCALSKSKKGTVRIFMAPRFDEKGKRLSLKAQRRLMFPLDAFPVKLKVGRNIITRYSEDSSLTQPWTKSIRDFERGPDQSGGADFCGCGFPQHLYIPKGSPSGMPFDVFVMVTNYDDDFVPNDPKDLTVPETCNSPYIFCSLPRRRYPDSKPMGYPFDRPLYKSICPEGFTFISDVFCRLVNFILNKENENLEQYAAKASNMASLQVIIRHLNTFLPEPARHK